MPPGDRELLAERFFSINIEHKPEASGAFEDSLIQHPLLAELDLRSDQILSLIANAKRLKMAVRGWVAEEHLRNALQLLPGVSECSTIEGEGVPDLQLRWQNGPMLTIECKNVLRKPNAAGIPRLDFQRTRAAKNDPCSRYYASDDFDVVAGCLHAVTENWEFRYIVPPWLGAHSKCPGKLASNVLIDDAWQENAGAILSEANRIRSA